jgi:hypothetical protein
MLSYLTFSLVAMLIRRYILSNVLEEKESFQEFDATFQTYLLETHKYWIIRCL